MKDEKRFPGQRLEAWQVKEIRQIWAKNVTQKELAAKYGVTVQTITKIVCDITWKNLPSVAEYRRELNA